MTTDSGGRERKTVVIQVETDGTVTVRAQAMQFQKN